VIGKNETKSKAGEFVVRVAVERRYENFVIDLFMVLVIVHKVSGRILEQTVGRKVQQQAKEGAELCCREHGWRVSNDPL
jgi:hypothetical protein